MVLGSSIISHSANINSIRETGLMSATNLLDRSIASKMNSDEKSRTIDTQSGLQNYVRLSFCSKNPMMFVSKKERRISEPVVLRIKLEAVSRPGVLFSDCNATRHDAIISASPEVVRFEIAKADNVFKVPELLRRFYQAEVLVPSPLPPHLIIFPRRKNGKKADTSSPSLPPPCTKESKEQRTRTERIEKKIDSSLDASAARVLAPGRPCLGTYWDSTYIQWH